MIVIRDVSGNENHVQMGPNFFLISLDLIFGHRWFWWQMGGWTFCKQLLTMPNFLAVWKRKIWQFGKRNFDSLEKEILDSLEREILTVWKGKFWQFGKGNFGQFGKRNFDSLKKEILTVWKRKFWQFEKGNFDSLKKEIFTVDSNQITTVKIEKQCYLLHSIDQQEKLQKVSIEKLKQRTISLINFGVDWTEQWKLKSMRKITKVHSSFFPSTDVEKLSYLSNEKKLKILLFFTQNCESFKGGIFFAWLFWGLIEFSGLKHLQIAWILHDLVNWKSCIGHVDIAFIWFVFVGCFRDFGGNLKAVLKDIRKVKISQKLCKKQHKVSMDFVM
jgi:hypothetical protein